MFTCVIEAPRVFVMRRRDFLALTRGAITALAFFSRSRAAIPKDPNGRCTLACGQSGSGGSLFHGLNARVSRHGYGEGRWIKFEHRYANEDPHLFQAQPTELAAAHMDVLIASVRPATLAAQHPPCCSCIIGKLFLSTKTTIPAALLEELFSACDSIFEETERQILLR